MQNSTRWFAKMDAVNILDLNDDSLGYIFKYLTAEEQIHFAQVCHRFRKVFIAWNGKQYREFMFQDYSPRQTLIGFCICREAIQTLTIDLDHFNTQWPFRCNGCEAPSNCFSILCLALGGMVSLERLIVKQPLKLNTPVEKPFEQIFTAVKDLNKLNVLKLHARDDWTFDTLWQLSHLEELYLHIQRIEAPILVECCKSNPNLRLLHLGYASVLSNLGAIVPHCGNLESLQFGMMAEAAAYKPLAKLPKLRQIIYSGVRRSNSFVPLLTALAVQPQLLRLDIDGGTLSTQEILQIVRLDGLQQLKCFCSTAECVERLAQLTQLQTLSIWMCSGCDISDALLKVIGECRQLQVLRIASGNLQPDFIDDVSELLIEQRAEADPQSLQLELPHNSYAKPIEEASKASKVLKCSTFEFPSWKL